ncbi:uncharacterized protein LOC119106849, partial [Pollicipes pollicipes]
MYCLPGPAVPLRYMYHQLVGPEQPQHQPSYMGVYPGGGTTLSSAPAHEAGYYMTSPPAAGPPVYPLSPFYGQQTYAGAAGRPAAEPSAVPQQVLGYAAQYPSLVSAGPPVAGRLMNGHRLRSAESLDDSLLLHHHHPHPLAAPAPAFQRPVPL